MKITRQQLRKLISEAINEGYQFSFYSAPGTEDDFTANDRWEDYKERPFYAEMFIEQGLDDQEMTVNQSDFLMELNQGPERLEKYRAEVKRGDYDSDEFNLDKWREYHRIRDYDKFKEMYYDWKHQDNIEESGIVDEHKRRMRDWTTKAQQNVEPTVKLLADFITESRGKLEDVLIDKLADGLTGRNTSVRYKSINNKRSAAAAIHSIVMWDSDRDGLFKTTKSEFWKRKLYPASNSSPESAQVYLKEVSESLQKQPAFIDLYNTIEPMIEFVNKIKSNSKDLDPELIALAKASTESFRQAYELYDSLHNY